MTSVSPLKLGAISVGVIALIASAYLSNKTSHLEMRPTARPISEAASAMPNRKGGATLLPMRAVAAPSIGGGVTSAYQALYDSDDILASVRSILAKGTPDEKGFASQIMRECRVYTAPKPFAANLLSSEITKRQRAWDQSVASCKGVNDLPVEDRKAMRTKLDESAKTSSSDYAALGKLSSRELDGERRWSSEDAKLVTAYIYSTDRIMREQAINDLIFAIDRDAPGGDARVSALFMVRAEQGTDLDTTNFRQRFGCINFGWCGSEPTIEGNAPLTSEALRLKHQYLDAMARHATASELLGIH